MALSKTQLALRLLGAALLLVLVSKVVMVDVHIMSGQTESRVRPTRPAAPQPAAAGVVGGGSPSEDVLGLGSWSPTVPRAAAPASHPIQPPPLPPVAQVATLPGAAAPAAPDVPSAGRDGSAQASGGSVAAPAVNPFGGSSSGSDVWQSTPKAGAAHAAPVVAAPAPAPAQATTDVAAPPVEAGAVTSPGGGHHHTIPIAHDLEWHKENKHCWKHFDLGLLDLWNEKLETFCTPSGEGGTHLRCRETVDHHLPAATAPHTFCDATNLGFRFNRMKPARCQKHRPGYKCDGEPYYYSYHGGALMGACTRVQRAFQLSRFPRDHLRDIFDSWSAGVPVASMPKAVHEAPITLFITRERNEHANLFHAMTDFLNAYQALHMLGVIDARREGHRDGMENVGVVLLDEQPEGPFDMVFDHVFSPNFPVKRVHDFARSTPEVLFKHAVFVHPGYTNWLFVQLFEKGSCERSLQMLQSFREFFLDGMKIETKFKHPDDVIDITFISRKPYLQFVEHKFMGRQVTNENELMKRMNALPGVKATLVDFATITFQEQIHLVTNTDIMVGMHGAALTHALWLPPWGAVLEMWPKEREMWRCFEHWSQLAGHAYQRYENAKKSNFRADKFGDYTRIEPDLFMDKVNDLVASVSKKRQELAGLAGGKR